MFENVGDSVQGLRNIAYVINVKGYETMAPRKLGLKILLETHPDKFRKKSKCVQKIYERIAKTATVLHNLA